MLPTLFLLATLAASPSDAAPPDQEANTVLVYDPFDSPAFADALDVIAGIAAPDRETPRIARGDIDELLGEPAGEHPGLQCYRLGKHREADQVWRVFFTDVTGWLAIRAFDFPAGVEVFRMVKVRSVDAAALDDEHRARIVELAQGTLDALEQKRAACAVQDGAYEETLRWPEPEDATQYGFDWDLAPQRVTVSFVVPESSVAEAGLQAGDVVVEVNGHEATSPAAFGRQMMLLQPGHALNMIVQRGAEHVKIAGHTEPSSVFVPRSQRAVQGRTVGDLLGDEAPALQVGHETWPRVTVLLVLRGVQENTLFDLPVLQWIQDRQGDAGVQVVGVATEMDEARTAELRTTLRTGFPLVPDPDRSVERNLRVFRRPSYVLLDDEGRVRFRPADDVALHHAIGALLAE